MEIALHAADNSLAFRGDIDMAIMSLIVLSLVEKWKPLREQSSAGVRADNIPLAIGAIVFTVLALSLGDALIKLTSSNFVIWQIFVLRSAITIPVLLIVMRVQLRAYWHWPVDLGWTVLRSLLLVCMWISYYLALPHLQLSVAAAAYYTLPIFITLFSASFVGDSISRFGWIAVFLGFFGVLLILKPSSGDFNWYALLPLVSAMLYAVSMILTRTKCSAEHPLILSLALNIVFVVVGGCATILINLFARMCDDIDQLICELRGGRLSFRTLGCDGDDGMEYHGFARDCDLYWKHRNGNRVPKRPFFNGWNF